MNQAARHDSAPLGFFAGLRYAFRGMRFVYVQHPGLARLYVWPILVVFGLVVADLVLAFGQGDAIVEHFVAAPVGDGTTAGALRALHHVAGFLVAFVLAALGLVATAILSPVLAAPFNDALSAEVERLTTGAEPAPFEMRRLAGDILRTVRVELTKVVLFVLVMGPLFVASLFFPVVGQALYSIFGVVFTVAYVAIDYVDWAASRRGLGVRDRVRLLGGHLRPMLGFGVGVAVLLFLPFVQLFFMPAAVAGGTLLFLDLGRSAAQTDGSAKQPLS